MKIFLHFLFTMAMFYFSEGKPCPEQYRPHKTRCDAYFKCVNLPSKNYVWTPEKCDRGLIFETNLKKCVLPGDDWECLLGDDIKKNIVSDENNVYGVNLLGTVRIDESNKINQHKENENKGKLKFKETIEVKNDDDYENIIFGNGNNVVIDLLNNSESDANLESSGDGFIEDAQTELVEVKDNNNNNDLIHFNMPTQIMSPSNIDPNLTKHLQRLTQLIDGLKEKYQNKDFANNDLRPDQLNAFLAHHNIKSEFEAATQTNLLSSNIQSNIFNFNKTNNNNYTNKVDNTETKVTLKNSHAKRYRYPESQYSNSQIVVNRPEGSVLFSLTANPPDSNNSSITKTDLYPENYKHVNKYQNGYKYDDDEPRISEDTLKTVLELSKQMISNQNIRQILPSNNYYQPIVQPFYYPVPVPSYQSHNYHHTNDFYNSNEQFGANYKKHDEGIKNYPLKNHENNPPTSLENNVIPVSITTNSKQGNIQPPLSYFNTATSTDRYPVDSYGYKLSPYIDYPPYFQLPLQQNTQFNNQNLKPFVETPTTESTPPQNYHHPQQVTIANYYTPNHHLDNSNVNSVFPTISPYDHPSSFNLIDYQKQQLHQFNQQKYSDALYSALKEQQISNNQPHINKDNSELNKIQNSISFENNLGQQSDEFINGANENVVQSVLTHKLDQNLYRNDEKNQQELKPFSNQLVNLGGNFISYDVYKNQLLPTLNNNFGEDNNGELIGGPEIITCKIGVRQANKSDCTKYYVCSKMDSKILTYSCPPYTAFNSDTRICDAQTYALCHPQAIIDRYTIAENQKIQIQALKVLQNAKRIRNEAQQKQNLANLLRLQTQKVMNETNINNNNQDLSQNLFNLMNLNNNNNNQEMNQQLQQQLQKYQLEQMLLTSTSKPLVIGVKRRKYYCKDGDKVADQVSNLNYYVCYKNKDGAIQGHKMTCSVGLIFCAKTKMCTLARNCFG